MSDQFLSAKLVEIRDSVSFLRDDDDDQAYLDNNPLVSAKLDEFEGRIDGLITLSDWSSPERIGQKLDEFLSSNPGARRINRGLAGEIEIPDDPTG